MRRAILLIGILLCVALPCHAQQVTVTATITSSDGLPYSGATGTAVLVTPGNAQPMYGNQTVNRNPQPISGINGFGTFSIQLWNTTLLTPATVYYRFNFTDATGHCSFQTPTIAISGTVDLSTFISSYAAPLAPCGVLPVGGVPFNKVVSGTNTGQNLTVGNGSNLHATGTGIINATLCNGVVCGSAGVSSLNSLTGAVTLSAGSNVTLTPSGNNIAIAAAGGGGSGGWYVASQSIQWVSALGLDTNDGLSPATAKLTWDRACTALTGGSNSPPLTCGQGTIYVIGSVAANTDATKGRWLMGLTDVNYASPPTGWYRSSGALRTICVGGNNSVYANGSVATCTVSGGSSTPGIPGLWLSNLFNFEDDHIAVQQYLGSPVRIGIDSTGNRDLGAVSSVYLHGIGINFGTGALGQGPGIDIGSLSFYNYIDHASITGNPAENFTGTLSRTSGTVTFITGATNDYVVGEMATVTNSTDPSFNGSFVVTAFSGTPQTHVQWTQALGNSTSAYGELFNYHSYAIAMNPGTGSGGEALFLSDSVLNSGGGVWFTAGVGGAAELHMTDVVVEGYLVSPPAVLVTSQNGATKIDIDHMTFADYSNAGISVELDNGCYPDQVKLRMIDAPVNGCATIDGVWQESLASVTATPLVQGQVGTVGSMVYGQTDAAARQFSPSTVRYANIATQYAPSAWTYAVGAGAITTGISAPDGTTGAGKATSTSGQSFVLFYGLGNASISVGDIYIYGAWVQNVSANADYANPLTFTLGYQGYGSGDSCTSNSRLVIAPIIQGQGEWSRVWGICKVAAAPVNAGIALEGLVDATHTGAFYAPTIFKIASGTISDNEAWAIASNLAFYPPSCTVGQLCTPTGAMTGTPASPTLSLQYNNAGAFGSVTPPADTQTYILTANNTTPGGVWGLSGQAINDQTGTTYTFLSTDRGKVVKQSNGSASTFTIPLIGSTGFTNSFNSSLFNRGVGLATLTPSSPDQINGTTTQKVPTDWVAYYYNDGTNWFAPVLPSIEAFPSCADSGGNHLNFTTATGLISCGTTSSGGGGGSVFPVTVSGTVTSGGIPCFNSTTNMETSAAITVNDAIVGGGAGACVADSGIPIFLPDADTTSIAIGVGALVSQGTTSLSNTAIGLNALHTNTSGGDNTAIGNEALHFTTGGLNTGISYAALYSNGTGANNTAIGSLTLFSNTTGSFNTAIGNQAGYTASTGNANVSGANNTWIGYQSGPGTATQLSNAVGIGYRSLNTASNQSVIGNTDTTSFIPYGTVSVLGTTPGIASNAGSPSIVGADNGGTITTGAASTTSTVTFANGWATWASCVVSASTSTALPWVSAISKTAVTFTYVTIGTPKLYYHCDGQ